MIREPGALAGGDGESIAFRPLTDADFESAYRIVVEATDWLNSKGIRQWPHPIPEDVYRARHDRGENFGLYVDGTLAVVLSLMFEVPDRWPELEPQETFRWLATMAASRSVRRPGLGDEALRAAENYLRSEDVEAIYLDCVEGNGFLPRFYSEAGYERIDSREMRPGLVMHLFRKSL